MYFTHKLLKMVVVAKPNSELASFFLFYGRSSNNVVLWKVKQYVSRFPRKPFQFAVGRFYCYAAASFIVVEKVKKKGK